MTATTLPSGTPVQLAGTRGKPVKLGVVVGGDTFRSHPRDPDVHLFRGGKATMAEALAKKAAAWGCDLEVMETLARDYGVQYVEVPTTDGRIFRTRMESLLGPKSFTHKYGAHRPQTFLPLDYWTESRV